MSFLAGAALLALLAAPDAAEADRLARQILSDDSYQRHLPGQEPPNPGTRNPTQPQRPGRAIGGGGNSDTPRSSGSLGSLDGLGEFLAWTILAVVAGLILFWIVRELSLRSDRNASREADAAAPARPRAGLPVPALPSKLDRLVAEGRYGEAIHLMLLLALDRLTRNSPADFPESLTSREVARRMKLEEPAHKALAHLVLGVERAHFGGAAPGNAEFELCRKSYDTLLKIPGEAA